MPTLTEGAATATAKPLFTAEVCARRGYAAKPAGGRFSNTKKARVEVLEKEAEPVEAPDEPAAAAVAVATT